MRRDRLERMANRIAETCSSVDALRQHRPVLDIGDGGLMTTRIKDW